MINTTTPFPQPRFAGKKAQNKPSVFKTALIGSLLASSGAGASLTGAKANPDKNALTKASPLGVDHHRALALTQGQQTDWDALILDEPGDAFEAGSEDEKVPTEDAKSKASQRKLLNTNASRPSGRQPYAAAVASPSLLKEKAAQAAWNASSLTPRNYELFSKVTFPFTKPMKPARLIPYTETSIKAQLVPFLNKITKGDKLKNAQALAVFNDPILKKKTNNDPKIRAMLASLQAMGFGAVVNTYKSNRFSTLKFHPVPFQDATGYSVRFSNETQQQVWLNPRYQGEDWKHLIDTVLHEALHDDAQGGNAEELINTAMGTLLEIKKRLLEPSLITQNTELSRRMNTAALARMASRGPNGELVLLNSAKPTGLPWGSFARLGLFDIKKPQDIKASPGNPLLASLIKTFTGKTVTGIPNFDWKTIQLLDQNQKYLSYEELVQAAKLLQLSVMIPRTPRSMMELTEGSNQGPTFTELEPEKMTTGVAATPEADAKDNKAPKLSRRFLA
ncbi:hypothetical protein [Vampirovibrio chlorellavorus]|uniref:hypothetical protein n=1 Tax=Vampirovibrio chlorellavorus TaxID=758823 RepID=UPI0026F2263F|nr:hypothetical protein [Vampirovibrio chlorellavorus]